VLQKGRLVWLGLFLAQGFAGLFPRGLTPRTFFFGIHPGVSSCSHFLGLGALGQIWGVFRLGHNVLGFLGVPPKNTGVPRGHFFLCPQREEGLKELCAQKIIRGVKKLRGAHILIYISRGF